MEHFVITIRVAYDEATVPEGMEGILKRNVEWSVSRQNLLNDYLLEAEVDDWSLEVEEKQ
jgi:hypothetical protein